MPRAGRLAPGRDQFAYPIVLTRSLDTAKEWVRSKARGTERYGLVASSKAQRLKPHAIDIRVDVDPTRFQPALDMVRVQDMGLSSIR